MVISFTLVIKAVEFTSVVITVVYWHRIHP